jgi:5-methylcytosine-specific restriction endonuclease McrA
MTAILALDISGQPVKWINVEEAVHYYATDKVIFELGDVVATLRGGHNNQGIQSKISTKSIIAVSGGGSKNNKQDATLSKNDYLFRRDRCVCAYCGETFREFELTREHITPKAQGGKDTWMNLVTACGPCNHHKANRTPEQAGMELIYVPYIPSRWEGFILANRKILVDQMEYLTSKLPKHSRWHPNYIC